MVCCWDGEVVAASPVFALLSISFCRRCSAAVLLPSGLRPRRRFIGGSRRARKKVTKLQLAAMLVAEKRFVVGERLCSP